MSDGAPVRHAGPAGASGTILRSVAARAGGRSSFAAAGPAGGAVPDEARAPDRPGLPEVAEIDLVRHYTRLSQMNHGVDTGLLPARARAR